MLEQIPCAQLTGVGPQLAKKLAKLNLHNVVDLLLHLPLRHEDRTRLTPLNRLQVGTPCLIEGTISHSELTYGRRRNLVCYLYSGEGNISLRLLHFSQQQRHMFKPGHKVRAFGDVRWGQQGPEMVHPDYRLFAPELAPPLPTNLTPVYPTTAGISQNLLRKLTSQALAMLKHQPLVELLPTEILQQHNYPDINKALAMIHNPEANKTSTDTNSATERLILEELIAHQIGLLQLRSQTQRHTAIALTKPSPLWQQLRDTLPFQLTGAQQRVITEISQDLKQPKPMLRLLQGDVGCGKTIVAVAAILQSVANGQQAAIMAPTELLAEQHYRNFQQWLAPYNLNLAWLSGTSKVQQRREALSAIAAGSAQVIVGTHAIFQQKVEFAHLALTIVDEQHRFGVHQRLALQDKGRQQGFLPHQLVMTATPIPRTLAMLAYADLDCSVIDELPANRQPITTTLISSSRRQQVIDRVRAACQEGQQAYWVCPLIEESEVLQCQAATLAAAQLAEQLPELRIGLVHGRLTTAEKQHAMQQFLQGKIDLLVATTVIEVGVDVSNASLMIIENPERLGLAQLHQLRGRVGRGQRASHCVLLYQTPLSNNAKQRLEAMRNTTDGFRLAQLDLELRGPGELLGTRQTGLVNLRLAELTRDSFLLPQAQLIAKQLLQTAPETGQLLLNRWLGSTSKYAHV